MMKNMLKEHWLGERRCITRGIVLIFVKILVVTVNASAENIVWRAYSQPFSQPARVMQYNEKITPVIVTVFLPSDFVSSGKEALLTVDLESNVRNSGANDVGFEDFRPTLRVNKATFKRYTFSMKRTPRRQTSTVTIKAGDLKAGENTLEFSFAWRGTGWSCAGKGCGYTMCAIMFPDGRLIARQTEKPRPTPTPRPRQTEKPRPTPTPRPRQTEKPRPTPTPMPRKTVKPTVQRATPTPEPTQIPTTVPMPAQKKLALLIGNGAYPDAPLTNPVNDARKMAAALKRLGFEVIVHENVGQKEMKRAIDKFGHALKGYDAGLFFYSGHGIQVNGENYLMPVDANPASENDVEYDCVNAGRILGKMEDAENKTNIIILDACRNNPFERSWTRSAKGKGLAFMNAPSGSLIAYATSPGNVAFDMSESSNSPYTAALLQHIETPNITISEMFQRVRSAVMRETNDEQIPWESTSLTGNFYFNQQ